jgi:hypothetical protein
MNPIEKLRVEADRTRSLFFKSVASETERLSPEYLLDQAIGRLDPGNRLFERIGSQAKRNPLALLAALGGLWFFVKQVKDPGPKTQTAPHQSTRPRRLKGALPKGDNHGYHNNTDRI